MGALRWSLWVCVLATGNSESKRPCDSVSKDEAEMDGVVVMGKEPKVWLCSEESDVDANLRQNVGDSTSCRDLPHYYLNRAP